MPTRSKSQPTPSAKSASSKPSSSAHGGSKKDGVKRKQWDGGPEQREYESRSVDVEQYPSLVESGIPELAARSRELAGQITEMEQERKAINETIKEAMNDAGAESVHGEDWLVYRATGRSASKISPELLLKNGVSMPVIQKSTVQGASYEYIQVRDRSGK